MLTRQLDRDGTEVDAAAVEALFVSLGFEVMRYDDLTINDMSINLREGTAAAAFTDGLGLVRFNVPLHT